MRYNSTILKVFCRAFKTFLLKILKKNGEAFQKYFRTIVPSLASRNSNSTSLHASKGALMWHNQSSFFSVSYKAFLLYSQLSFEIHYLHPFSIKSYIEKKTLVDSCQAPGRSCQHLNFCFPVP